MRPASIRLMHKAVIMRPTDEQLTEWEHRLHSIDRNVGLEGCGHDRFDHDDIQALISEVRLLRRALRESGIPTP